MLGHKSQMFFVWAFLISGTQAFLGLSQPGKPCILKDGVNFREFDFAEYSPNLTQASNERVILNFCQGGIPLDELKNMCFIADHEPHQNIFFAYLLEPKSKKCRLYTNSDIDDTIFDRSHNTLSILISESHPDVQADSFEEFLAFKIILYEVTDTSKDPDHKYLKLLNRDPFDQYERIIFQISHSDANIGKRIQIQNFSFGSIDIKVL